MSLSLFAHHARQSTIPTIARSVGFPLARRPRNFWRRWNLYKQSLRAPAKQSRNEQGWIASAYALMRFGELLPCEARAASVAGSSLRLLAMTTSRLLASRYLAFTGRFPWLSCGTPRFSDIWECVHSQPSAFLENTSVARPGRGNGFPSA